MKTQGFHNVTIGEISKKAGVSVGAFYHYFKSKNDILAEIYHRANEFFEAQADRLLAEPDISAAIISYFNLYAKQNVSTGIDFTKQLYSTGNKLFLNTDRPMLKILYEIIRRGQESGKLFSDQSADLIADDLIVAARGMVFDWCLHDGEYDLELRMTQYFSHVIAYIVRS